MHIFQFVSVLIIAAGLASSQDDPLPGFKSPDKTYGVKFRYWVPDASADIAQVVADIEALDAVGAGGAEFIPLYNYGRWNPSLPNWDVYGFGSEAFRDVFRAALNASAQRNMSFDFAIGANQGQGVPAPPLTPGLAKQLVYSEATLRGGEKHVGEIPRANPHYNFHMAAIADYMHKNEDFGPSELIAVAAAGVKNVTRIDGKNLTQLDVLLDEASLLDLTASVVDNKLEWTAPQNHSEYRLFAVYERFSNQRSVDAIDGAQELIGNGSWITDHFSATGAKLMVEFWDQHILDDEVRGLLKNAARHTWEDSMEMASALWWGDGFLERFTASRGYSPAKYLPLLFHKSHSYRAEYSPYNTTYRVDGVDGADPSQHKYLQDYRLTLTEGYQDYLKTIEQWSHGLGLTFSAEVAYSLPVELGTSVPSVGAPEVESLAFPTIDNQVHFASAAHLTGQRRLSSEIGATLFGAYTQSPQFLKDLFHDAFSAGINTMIVHGYSFGGEMLSTWPGFTALNFGFGESWGPRIPAWRYMDDLMRYTARTQVGLRFGKPRIDLAFYRYDEPWSSTSGYVPSDLRDAGFSYSYLSPGVLANEASRDVNGTLAPDGAGYRALIFNNQTFITPAAARRVLELAESGLPIFIIGHLPDTTIGTQGQDEVTALMLAVGLLQSRVYKVEHINDAGHLAQALLAQGIKPAVSINGGQGNACDALYSFWTVSETKDVVFLYNRGEAGTFNLIFTTDLKRKPNYKNKTDLGSSVLNILI